MGFPLDSFGISLGILSDFRDTSIRFLWHFYEISAGFLWDFENDFYGIAMVFPWYSCGISIGFACGFYGIPWDLCDIPGRFIWDSLRFL